MPCSTDTLCAAHVGKNNTGDITGRGRIESQDDDDKATDTDNGDILCSAAGT